MNVYSIEQINELHHWSDSNLPLFQETTEDEAAARALCCRLTGI